MQGTLNGITKRLRIPPMGYKKEGEKNKFGLVLG
jgi:hypothetical protein